MNLTTAPHEAETCPDEADERAITAMVTHQAELRQGLCEHAMSLRDAALALAAAAAALFTLHVTKENDILLPALQHMTGSA